MTRTTFKKHIFAASLAALLASLAIAANAGRFKVEAVDQGSFFQVPATGAISVAFSPNEGAERLVIETINSAKSELKILAYSFTSATVTEAILKARKRGVNVYLVADYKNNISEDRSGKANAALSALVTAGCDVRTIRVYPIHHDKVIIADRQTVELGSFNFSNAAAHHNSENVLVNWNNPQLAAVYLAHFERNQKQSDPFKPGY